MGIENDEDILGLPGNAALISLPLMGIENCP